MLLQELINRFKAVTAAGKVLLGAGGERRIIL
jgi:hypothetical protein